MSQARVRRISHKKRPIKGAEDDLGNHSYYHALYLSEYGFDAQVVALPGHSKGSIGLLTAQGDFFCGDLLANVGKPDVWSIMDDPVAANDSLEKLTTLEINTVYPGHGRPCLMPLFLKQSQVTA